MSISRTTVVVIVLALVLIAATGYLLFGKSETTGVVAASASPASEAELTFLALTARIDPVDFDTSILEDPRFMALRDLRTTVVPETMGRFDPFAPLGR